MAITYKKITKDNEVFSKDVVQVEQTDDTPIKKIVTPRALNTERQVIIALIANKETELTKLDIQIAKVDVEASKVELKIKEE